MDLLSLGGVPSGTFGHAEPAARGNAVSTQNSSLARRLFFYTEPIQPEPGLRVLVYWWPINAV